MITLVPPAASVFRRARVRREVNLLLNLALLGLVVLSFASGWAASLLGLTEFGLHKFSSIALLVVATGHVVLHWRSLSNELQKRLRRKARVTGTISRGKVLIRGEFRQTSKNGLSGDTRRDVG